MSKIIEDKSKVLEVFSRLKVKKEKIWIWQFTGKGKDDRIIHLGSISAVSDTEIRLSSNGRDFNFTPNKEVFAFAESLRIAFKGDKVDIDGPSMKMKTPKRLKVIDEDESKKIELVEIENEDRFSHLRKAPRIVVRGLKFVYFKSKSHESGDSFPLYDLSRGGLAFLVEDPGLYKVGETITIQSIDGAPLEHPIDAEIVSMRRIPDCLEGEIKIGVKFL